jgi:hypothetical protein
MILLNGIIAELHTMGSGQVILSKITIPSNDLSTVHPNSLLLCRYTYLTHPLIGVLGKRWRDCDGYSKGDGSASPVGPLHGS